jgi:hypothetical protein
VFAMDRPQSVVERDRIASGNPLESHAQCSAVPSKRRPIGNNTIFAQTDRERSFAVHIGNVLAMMWFFELL